VKVGIVGAGLAGLSCGTALQAHGVEVALFEKARGPGGRLCSRRLETRLGTATFDFGAQAIGASDPKFLRQLEAWRACGTADRWQAGGAAAWAGTPAMNAIPKHLALGLKLACSVFVRGMVRDRGEWHLLHDAGSIGPFDAVVIALPAEQAATMLALHDLPMARIAIAAPSAPCWTAMLALAPREGPLLLESHGIIDRAASSASKPGRSGPQAWTVHAGAQWSQAHLDADAAFVIETLRGALADGLGGAPLDVLAADSHRWRYATSGAAGRDSLWNAALGIGACGDWLIGPGAQSAWLSGVHLAGRIAGAS